MYIYIYMYVCMMVCINMNVCMYVCMYNLVPHIHVLAFIQRTYNLNLISIHAIQCTDSHP